MKIISPRKRLEAIEKEVIPSMFVGVLSKDNKWMEHTLTDTLPQLEARALRLAEECKRKGECTEDDPLCDVNRIRKLFRDTRTSLENEHSARESRTRFAHY